MRRGDDFIAVTQAQCPQCHVDRVRAVRARDATLHAQRFRPRLFKSIHLPATNIGRLGNYFGDSLVNLVFDGQILRVKINKWNFHSRLFRIRTSESETA